MHRLKQIAIRAIYQFEVNTERGIKVCQHFTDYGDFVVPGRSQVIEFFRGHEFLHITSNTKRRSNQAHACHRVPVFSVLLCASKYI